MQLSTNSIILFQIRSCNINRKKNRDEEKKKIQRPKGHPFGVK
jgi:hypothetical protein